MKRFFAAFIFIGFFFIVARANAVQAQIFKFELANPDQTINVNSNFEVKILINTGGVEMVNGDALISFDSAKLSVNSAKSGNFFTYFSATPLGGVNNKYLVSSYEESIAHAKVASSDTLFATLNLTAKESSTTNLTFDCTDATESDSNINRASDSKDVIKCPLQPLTINIGGAGPTATPTATFTPSPTSSPTATLTPKPTSTPRPTSTSRPVVTRIPRAGATGVTAVAIGVGAILTIAGLLIIL